MKAPIYELLETIERGADDNTCLIHNVHLFVKSWKKEQKIFEKTQNKLIMSKVAKEELELIDKIDLIQSKYTINTIKSALEYALKILKDQAEKGIYPESALAQNGGKGFQPITEALNILNND